MFVKLTPNHTQENVQPQSLSPTSYNAERWKKITTEFKTEKLLSVH